MSKNRLGWIIGLMSIAVIGLIAFQWYWINSVISGNKDRFQRDVMTSLFKVAEKLERREALTFVDKKLRQSNTNSKINTAAILKRQFSAPSTVSGGGSIVSFQDSIDGLGTFNFSMEIMTQTYGNAPIRKTDYPFSSPNEIVQMDPAILSIFGNYLDSLGISLPIHNFDQALKKVSNKSNMMMTLLEEMMHPQIKLVNRLDLVQLDSLLKFELAQKSIYLDYDYAVFEPLSGQLVGINDPLANDQVLKTDFKTNLFPNDLLGEPSLLLINFPEQKKYLLEKILLTLSSSALLVLLILACFGYAVYIIVRQKNISLIKTDFINNMTHEFKTPIATIGLAVEALLDKEISQNIDMKMKYLGIIGEENKRLSSQVSHVLQMAQIDRKELKLALTTIDVHEIIRQAVEKISIQIENKSGYLNLALNAHHYTIKGDEGHMLGVLLNLLDNAIKYSQDAPNIIIRTQERFETLVLSIKDHGIGMSKEAQRNIFQKFYRVSTGDLHDVKGFGLGLSYAKEIIGLFHGTIEVESDLNKGTNFIIKLPLTHE